MIRKMYCFWISTYIPWCLVFNLPENKKKKGYKQHWIQLQLTDPLDPARTVSCTLPSVVSTASIAYLWKLSWLARHIHWLSISSCFQVHIISICFFLMLYSYTGKCRVKCLFHFYSSTLLLTKKLIAWYTSVYSFIAYSSFIFFVLFACFHFL
jgi:hypothetical protein